MYLSFLDVRSVTSRYADDIGGVTSEKKRENSSKVTFSALTVSITQM